MTSRCPRKFLQAFTRWHVPCAMCHQSTHDRHHRRSAVLARRMVPRRSRSDQPFGRYSRKCLNTHTPGLTNTSGQLCAFFTDPPVEIFVHRTFNAKAFERSFTTILENPTPKLEDDTKTLMKKTLQNKIPDDYLRKILPQHSRTAEFYGLPKTHKPGNPLRHICSIRMWGPPG